MSKFILVISLLTSLLSYSQEEVIIPIDFSEYEKLFVPPIVTF